MKGFLSGSILGICPFTSEINTTMKTTSFAHVRSWFFFLLLNKKELVSYSRLFSNLSFFITFFYRTRSVELINVSLLVIII